MQDAIDVETKNQNQKLGKVDSLIKHSMHFYGNKNYSTLIIRRT